MMNSFPAGMRVRASVTILGAVLSLAAGMACASPKDAVAGETVDVRHWWMGISDDAALKVYKQKLAADGIAWHDSGVNDEQNKPLGQRVRNANGKAPDVLLLNANAIRENARSGLLLPFDELAAKEGWNTATPAAIQQFARPGGHWIALPIEIHRMNWLWINKKIFDRLKLAPPTTFAEMIGAANTLRAAGYIPLAHGGEDWQNALLLENAVLSAGGPKFYRQALVEFDQQALRSKTMEQAFAQLDALRGMVDARAHARAWYDAAHLLIRDKAGMQIMGDWVKSEYVYRGKKAGTDFLCVPYPGTAGSFVHVTDFFGLMKKKDNANRDVQMRFARAVMDRTVQEDFSIVKGSIPVRTDAMLGRMDACAGIAHAHLLEADRRHTLISSARQEIDNRAYPVIMKVAHGFMESKQTPKEGVAALAEAFGRYMELAKR
jgi:glucose/mannose transport system substrate-binding protein